MSHRQLAAIMFTDIAGYTAMMGKDEAAALIILRKSREIHQQAISKNNGKWLKEMGDGVLAQFNSALDAVLCALEIQKKACAEISAKIRIGIHLGDITQENEDVFGDGVNIASRLQAIADPGGIYVSESIQQAVHANANIKTRYLADLNLKNVGRPIRTYCIVEDWLPSPSVTKISKLSASRTKPLTYSLIGFAVILIVALVWWRSNQRAVLATPSIAILPISNLTGDSTNNILMAGIHSELRDQIANIKTLRVPSRTSTVRYQYSDKSIPEIAKELGVDVVLEPDIFEIGDSIRINVRLIKAFPAEHQLWSESFKTEMGSVFDVYNNIVRAIATEMNISDLEENSLPESNPVDAEAYKAYIEGLGHLYTTTPRGIDKALEYFKLALKKDPNYAPAHTGVAMVWGFRMQMGLVSSHEATPFIEEATSKALSLGGQHAEIHYLLATANTWGKWNWQIAEIEFKRTLEMDASNAEARAYYAQYLTIMNRIEEATQHMNKARELEPDNSLVQALYGMYLNHTRQFNKAIDRLNKTLVDDPDNPIALAALWTIYHNMGQYQKALETAKILYTARREYKSVEVLITGNQQGGYKSAMEGVANAYLKKMDTTFVPPWQIATLYTRAGNYEKAIYWLEEAYKAHDANMPAISCDPIFDQIESHPGFQDLLAKMQLVRSSQ